MTDWVTCGSWLHIAQCTVGMYISIDTDSEEEVSMRVKKMLSEKSLRSYPEDHKESEVIDKADQNERDNIFELIDENSGNNNEFKEDNWLQNSVIRKYMGMHRIRRQSMQNTKTRNRNIRKRKIIGKKIRN